MDYFDSSIRIAKTWAFGAAALATVMAFMPFAAVMIFLSPFFEISPVRVQLILCKKDEPERDGNDADDEESEEDEDDDSVSIVSEPEPETIYTHRPDLKERRDVYLAEVEEDAEEARANGFTEKAQQLEDVARILRTLWEIPKCAKSDTTPLREAPPLPDSDDAKSKND